MFMQSLTDVTKIYRALLEDFTVVKVPPEGTEESWLPRLQFPKLNVLSTDSLSHMQEKEKKA